MKRHPRLISLTEGVKQVIPLGRATLLIGRTEENEISLSGSEVSPNHASIIKMGPDYFIRDNGSVNGTFVNGERITMRKLEMYDVVNFGVYEFLVDLGDGGNMSVQDEKIVGSEEQNPSRKKQKVNQVYHLPKTQEDGSSGSKGLMVMTRDEK